MPLEINFSLSAEWPNQQQQGYGLGIYVLDHSLIAGQAAEIDGQPKYIFRESLDRGDSWQIISELTTTSPQLGNGILKLPTNRLIVATDKWEDNLFKIHLSTDGGHTWAVVHEYPDSGNPTSLIQNFCGLTWGRHGAVIGGYINRAQGGGHNAQLAFSADAGDTWTDAPNIVLSNMNQAVYALANGGSGKWLAANSQQWIHRSLDYGQSWTQLPLPEVPPDTHDQRAWAVTWIDDTHVLAGGGLGSEQDPYWPYLYRSADAGDTWTHVAAADIQGWPSSDYRLGVRQIQRLTKQGAIIGLEETRGRDIAPWRYSTDQGATWKEPTQTGYDRSQDNSACNGAISIDQSGNIWSLLDVRRDGGHVTQAWKGRVTC